MNLKTIAAFVSGLFRAKGPSQPAATPGNARIGRFPVLKSLGRGTQGAVYLARDPDLDRLVAIKLLSDTPGQAADAGGRWSQARNLAQLRHPNIVALYEIGTFESLTYLVFEYLEGATLSQELKACGALALPAAYGAILQITDAMAYAHAKGILHLDLSPNNIMRDKEGKLRIMDFDLSQRADAQARAGLVFGTLPYMAPECFKTQKLDARTDVYALGRILYTLLIGSPGLSVGTEKEMIASICEKDVDCSLLQGVDPTGHFAEVVRRATARNPAERFPNAGAMRDALVAAWEKLHPAGDAKDAVSQGTVAFLLKRIEHRGDFPAVSKTLAEINQITSDAGHSPVSHITSVVLRDYALTNRLLRLANSSYYPHPLRKVDTVSDAIIVLGLDEVRLACNSLACFGHFAGGSKGMRMREESIASFIAGLVSRHLAAEVGIKETEEAFLAAMLFNLGKALALYYFPGDYREIESLVGRGATPEHAARSVLGITLAELGHAVGEVWGLPPVVLSCMIEDSAADTPSAKRMRSIVRFADALTGVDPDHDPAGAVIASCAARLQPYLALNPAQTHALLSAAVEKFKTFAAVLEVECAKSTCVQRLERWLAIDDERALSAQRA
jgi:serine/threonine protein kinase